MCCLFALVEWPGGDKTLRGRMLNFGLVRWLALRVHQPHGVGVVVAASAAAAAAAAAAHDPPRQAAAAWVISTRGTDASSRK